MLNSIIRTPALILTVPLFALIAVSYPAHAEIYKWRDNRGVIQYSDRPPVENFTKVTRNEMVNALQTKDLCAVGPIVKNSPISVASNQNAGAFFFKFLRSSTTSTAPTTSTSLFKTSGSSAKLIRTSATSTMTTGSTNTTNRLASTSSSFGSNTFKNTTTLFGGKNVTVLGFSKKPINTVVSTPTTATPTTITTTPTTTAPTTTVPTTTTTTAPSITAPTTTVEAAPLVVATASPAPTTTTTTTTTTTNTSANLIQVGLMPAVDISKNMVPAVGFNSLRIKATTEVAPNSAGEFRVSCGYSHMSNDDPLVYPNQQGAAHHHTFFGNTSVNFKSDLNTFGAVGNSTCSGGTMNRSAYWVPSMINTETNTPIVPNGNALIYYKSGAIDGTLIKAPPKGLRMIAGNAKATNNSVYNNTGFTCHPGPNSTRTSWPRTMEIPSGSKCETGDDLMFSVFFPQCWDGVNLDSPNHKDHMAYPLHRSNQLPNFYCPTTHPVAIPQIAVNVHFRVTSVDKLEKWRLASDNYTFNGTNAGYSAHSDYVEGWDRTAMEGIIKNCINAKKDGHAHLLCDGRMFY